MESRKFFISITSCNGKLWNYGKIKYNNSSMDRNIKYKPCNGIYIS